MFYSDIMIYICVSQTHATLTREIGWVSQRRPRMLCTETNATLHSVPWNKMVNPKHLPKPPRRWPPSACGTKQSLGVERSNTRREGHDMGAEAVWHQPCPVRASFPADRSGSWAVPVRGICPLSRLLGSRNVPFGKRCCCGLGLDGSVTQVKGVDLIRVCSIVPSQGYGTRYKKAFNSLWCLFRCGQSRDIDSRSSKNKMRYGLREGCFLEGRLWGGGNLGSLSVSSISDFCV